MSDLFVIEGLRLSCYFSQVKSCINLRRVQTILLKSFRTKYERSIWNRLPKWISSMLYGQFLLCILLALASLWTFEFFGHSFDALSLFWYAELVKRCSMCPIATLRCTLTFTHFWETWVSTLLSKTSSCSHNSLELCWHILHHSFFCGLTFGTAVFEPCVAAKIPSGTPHPLRCDVYDGIDVFDINFVPRLMNCHSWRLQISCTFDIVLKLYVAVI